MQQHVIRLWGGVLCLGVVLTAMSSAYADQTARAMLADQYALHALQILQQPDTPTEAHFKQATVLLDLALDLQPGDAELWRLRAELARRSANVPELRMALERYLQLVPGDDAAQLQLVMTHLESIQTLDQRLTRIEGILKSTAGRQFSRPLRSQLASYAANAAKEMGDDARFLSWLKQAAALDPTNADAARMIYNLALQRQTDPIQVGAAAVNLVRAAPADPAARLIVAAVLNGEAQYRRAAEQFDVAATLAQGGLPSQGFLGWVFALAATGQDDQAMSLLHKLKHEDENGDALPIELQMLQLVIVSDPARPETGRLIYQQLKTALEQREHSGGMLLVDDVLQQWIVIAALFGQELDAVEQALPTLDAESFAVRQAKAWVALHHGQKQEALKLFNELDVRDGLGALGRALLMAEGAARAQVLQRVVSGWPTELAGLLAARELHRIQQGARPTRRGNTLVSLMDRYPQHLWQPAFTVSPWVVLQAEVVRGGVQAFEPVTLRVTIRNAAQFPMPIDAIAGIPTQAVIEMNASRAGQPIGPVAPIVIDVDRRLSLAPGDVMTFDMRLDRSQLGELVAADPTATTAVDVRVVLGPQPTTTGQFAPSPIGGTARVRAIKITGDPVDSASVQQNLAALEKGDGIAQLRAAAWLSYVVADSNDAGADLDTAGQTLTQWYRQASSQARAWTVLMAGQNEQVNPWIDMIRKQAARSDDVEVRIAHLLSEPLTASSPALLAGLRADDPLVRQFAKALRDAIAPAESAATEPTTTLPALGD